MLKLIGGRLYQWDLGRRLEVHDLPDGTQITEVDFCHPGDAEALVVIPDRSGDTVTVDIPNILLQSDATIMIYECVGDVTVSKIPRSVVGRERPADYVYTETQVLTYRALEERIAKLEQGGAGGVGTDGGYYSPNVDIDGNLTWTASAENMPAVAGSNIRGPQGEAGPAGADGAQGAKGDKGDTGDTGPAGADGQPGTDGKSAYQYAQDGGYTGTEADFAAKLAAEKFANPNALTFTGTVTGTYDGSAPLEVAIPSGGGESGDYIPNPSTASVGQTIVVKAVDENGKPTEWEAADMASGGGQAIDKIAIKITETVHSISLLADITLYNRIRANIKVVGDSANAASGVLGAITPSGALINYVLKATKTATGYLFFDLRLSEQGAESDITPSFAPAAYNETALGHTYGLSRTRWTGALSLVPNATDWNFGAGTEIYLEAYRA